MERLVSAKQKQAREKATATAQRFAQALVESMNDADPKTQAAFEASKAKRDEEVSKALAAHLAKRKK
jgi:hypothetical protein